MDGKMYVHYASFSEHSIKINHLKKWFYDFQGGLKMNNILKIRNAFPVNIKRFNILFGRNFEVLWEGGFEYC